MSSSSFYLGSAVLDEPKNIEPQQVEPAAAAPAFNRNSPPSTTQVLELLLKDQAKLDRLLADEAGQRHLSPKLLGIALAGFTIYGVVATVLLNLARQSSGFWLAGVPAAYWDGPSIANLTLAYSLGLIAANGICLPSFYFYGLLAGVRVSMLGVAAHALKGMAAGAVALVALVPMYVAVSLSVLVYSDNRLWLAELVMLALALPFLAGIFGAVCLYRGFVGLAGGICDPRPQQRACLLRRLILAWSACYTCVTPLAIYTLWQHLDQLVN